MRFYRNRPLDALPKNQIGDAIAFQRVRRPLGIRTFVAGESQSTAVALNLAAAGAFRLRSIRQDGIDLLEIVENGAE
jgi:hypothetical protein